MTKWLLAAAALLPLAANAQTAPSQLEQRVGAQLGQLLLQNTALQIQIEQLQAQLKDAKAKGEPVPDKVSPPPQ